MSLGGLGFRDQVLTAKRLERTCVNSQGECSVIPQLHREPPWKVPTGTDGRLPRRERDRDQNTLGDAVTAPPFGRS